VRYVFREFPLDIKAAAASVLARCIAKDDAGNFFAVIDMLFKKQDELVVKTKQTLKRIGREAGMSEQSVETCIKDQALACEQAGVAVTLPKPQTSGAKSAGRFGKPDFVYLAKDDVYRCPAGEKLAHPAVEKSDIGIGDRTAGVRRSPTTLSIVCFAIVRARLLGGCASSSL
jgi:hypothetical protein